MLLAGLFVTAQLTVRADSALWKSKTLGPGGQLPAFFPTPTASSGSPTLLVVPLLGPGRHLLPGGRLLVWVGRNDGTPLPGASITVNVPAGGNALVDSGARALSLTRQADAEGLILVQLTAPDIPPGLDGNGGGEGGGDPTPE